jgi:rhamnosyltransferase
VLKYALIIPTYNAAKNWPRLMAGLHLQSLLSNQVLIVDSSSTDGTRDLARAEGFRVVEIERANFNHGGTRQLAIELVPWAEIAVLLTQDVELARHDSITKLVAAFADGAVGGAYGRQLPRPAADPIEAHVRVFNYPAKSQTRDLGSRRTLGIKAAFLSNAFAAYRIEALCGVGGFARDVIHAEDFLAAGRLLLGGWKIAYVAEAEAIHSHSFTVAETFRHYFDVGVCLGREAWYREAFGAAGGEGKRFVLSELHYLGSRAPQLIPLSLAKTIVKFAGYQLGLRESVLRRSWSRRLSRNKAFWDR